MRALLVLIACLSSAAFADDVEPEFTLGDLGVRLELDDAWTMQRWSDWDFRASIDGGAMVMFAWGTPIQSDITEDELALWVPVYETWLEEHTVKDVGEPVATVAELGGRTVARIDVPFGAPGGRKRLLTGATVPLAGQMLHLALTSDVKQADTASARIASIVADLDPATPVPTLEGAQEVSAAGMSLTLPSGWRVPLRNELKAVTPRAGEMGVDDLADCWSAIRPRGPGEPDVMFACQGGMFLGVVDALSFADAEVLLRPKLFGAAEVAPATMVALPDRVGFLYTPDIGGRALAMGVVPYGPGVARVWAMGGKAHAEALATSVTAALSGAELEGEHPASIGERASYYLAYQPFSPMVLGPLLGLIAVVGGAGVMMRRSGGNRYEDLDD